MSAKHISIICKKKITFDNIFKLLRTAIIRHKARHFCKLLYIPSLVIHLAKSTSRKNLQATAEFRLFLWERLHNKYQIKIQIMDYIIQFHLHPSFVCCDLPTRKKIQPNRQTNKNWNIWIMEYVFNVNVYILFLFFLAV